MIIKKSKFSHTCQTSSSSIILVLLILPSVHLVYLKFKNSPNTCYRCDFNGDFKKVKPCPEVFDTDKVEIVECGYSKPICGITVNVTTDKPKIIYAGCYSKKFKRHCFKDQVRQYGPKNTSYCYHTCNETYLCNTFESWLKSESPGFDLFKLSIFG